MPVRPLLPTLFAAAFIGGMAPFAFGEGPADLPVQASAGENTSAPADFTPRPKRVFTDKPRIEDYADYNAFLVDIMEFRRQKQERQKEKDRLAAEAAARRAAAPAAAALLPDDTLASVSGRNAAELRELYEIRQPETLDDALARARKLPHPVYREEERFGRTTSNSFPIPQMEVGDMSSGGVEGLLQDLESLTPIIYRDDGADMQAETAVDDNEDGDEKDRFTRSHLGSLIAYRLFSDPSKRHLTITDSDGKTTSVPIIIEAEIGHTVIRTFEINIHEVDN